MLPRVRPRQLLEGILLLSLLKNRAVEEPRMLFQAEQLPCPRARSVVFFL